MDRRVTLPHDGNLVFDILNDAHLSLLKIGKYVRLPYDTKKLHLPKETKFIRGSTLIKGI